MTQWRVGLGGATGLDYMPLMQLLDRKQLSPDDWQDTFDCVQAIEAAALDQMRENSAS